MDDKAFDDLTHWPLDALPDSETGAIEYRRRAFEDALVVFAAYWPDEPRKSTLEGFETALSDALEAAGRPWPDKHWFECTPPDENETIG